MTPEFGILIIAIFLGLAYYYYKKDKKPSAPFEPTPEPTPIVVVEGVVIGPATYIERVAPDAPTVSTISVVDGVVTYMYDTGSFTERLEMPVTEFLQMFKRNFRRPPDITRPR